MKLKIFTVAEVPTDLAKDWQNITCTCKKRGSKFNVAPRYPDGRRDIPLMFAERI